MSFRFTSFILVSFLFISSHYAQTYYVSQYKGDDNNIGNSEASAFKTINKALSKSNTSTVIILDGAYHETISITNKNNIYSEWNNHHN